MRHLNRMQEKDAASQSVLSNRVTSMSSNALLEEFDSYIKTCVLDMVKFSPSLSGEADDIMQNIRIKFWLAQSKGTINNYRAYIRRMIRNEIIDAKRRSINFVLPLLFNDHGECTTTIADPGEDMRDPSDITHDELQTKALLESIISAILALPPRQRDAMLLRLKYLAGDLFGIEEALRAFHINLADIQEPKTPEERTRLASITIIARRTLTRHWNYADKTRPPRHLTVPVSAENNADEISGDNREECVSEQMIPLVKNEYDDEFIHLAPYLDLLKEPYQTAVRLYYVEHRSYTEMQTALHRSPGTIRTHVSRGLAMLREALKQQQNNKNALTPSQKIQPDDIPPEVYQRLAELPVPYQIVIRLHHIEHYPYKRLAEMLHIPLGTVKARVHRGMKLLSIP
jgi:DNA-directed RNA polymerase specialized sigma24 family protein